MRSGKPDETKHGALDVLDWLRISRAASFHAEKALIECMVAYAEGRDPLGPLRAGSHFIKKARECFNSAVEVCNCYCKHSYGGDDDETGEYASENAGQRHRITKEEANEFLNQQEEAKDYDEQRNEQREDGLDIEIARIGKNWEDREGTMWEDEYDSIQGGEA